VETTIACRHYGKEEHEQVEYKPLVKKALALLKSVFSCSHFSVQESTDVSSVEICGAVKNVVAMGAG
jgi:glycerol-3-phosphate dehydrogenase